MTRDILRLFCRHAACDNYCVIGYDDDAPQDWTCPTCADAMERQRVTALEQAEGSSLFDLMRRLDHLTTTPTRRS